MTAISRKKTALALVREVVEGTPVAPTSGNQFTALQDGYSVKPEFAKLTSAELQSSIGKSKGELGKESPSASLSHYMKASGTEGVAPDYKELLESAFGAVAIRATERDTVAGSSVSSLNVDVGEGAEFKRGDAVLIKDPVNGFSIRNIDTPVVDALPLMQVLATPPAALVLLGKNVRYQVADEGHPTFTSWYYQGNSGAIEMVAGNRVTELNITANAGEYINGAFTIGGIKYYYNPVYIGAADIYLDFLDNATVRVAQIAQGFYKDPIELADALAAAMNALGSGNTFTVSYSSTNGKYTIASNGATLTLKWNTGANAANSIGSAIGFLTAADDSAALTYTSDNALDFSAPYTPNYNSTNNNVAKANEAWIGGINDVSCFKIKTIGVKLSNTKADIGDVCEASGVSGSLITARDSSVELTAQLSKYEADKFKRFRAGDKTQFTWNFGLKSGGVWVAGSIVNIFLASATIDSFEIVEADGLCDLKLTLSGYVENGKPELFLNFL